MATLSITNETPTRITLVGVDDKEISLAPMQQKEIDEDSSFDFTDLELGGVVSRSNGSTEEFKEKIIPVVIGAGFWLVVIGMVVVNREPFFGISPEYWPLAVWGFVASTLAAIVISVYVTGTNSASRVIRWSIQAVSLTVILAIGVGLPAATIYYFGGGQELLSNAGPIGIEASPSNDASNQVQSGVESSQTIGVSEASALPLALYGRLIQLAFIAIASLLPVLLFFLFDRFCLGTLRKRLYMSLFRLDRTLKTTGEINAKYGAQIDEAFGPQDLEQGRLSPGTRWPVLVCALVITIGWTVSLAPVGAFDPQNGSEVIASLLPQSTPLVFGFLGVYFYSLGLIAIRYARGDLKPKAYTHIMVRIFVVAVLSWVLETVAPENTTTTLLLAFLFGITPSAFFIWLKEIFRGRVPSKIIPQPTLPLQELEGIDLYDLGRLESEGIVNIEGLAHHELIDLIIETRIPVPRLVDWIDQAILYLHITGGSNKADRKKLRDYGIRTATDLEVAWQKAGDRKDGSLDALRQLLGGKKPLYRLEVIRNALSDDEWMQTVTNWRDENPRDDQRYSALPSTAIALKKLGDQELVDGRYQNALQYYLRSIEAEDSAVARRRVALLLATFDNEDTHDPAAARVHAQIAYDLAPGEYQGSLDLFEVYLALNDSDKAEEMYEAGRAIVEGWDSSRQSEKKIELQRLQGLKQRLEKFRAEAKDVQPKTTDTISVVREG